MSTFLNPQAATRRRIYIASSWRNKYQPELVKALRHVNHSVYDFRNPPHGPGGFSWEEIAPNWENWTPSEYRDNLLNHPRAAQGFTQDMRGMFWCDTCILLLPSGNSAHNEAGWCAGMGKRTIVYIPEEEEEVRPDLMYLLQGSITCNLQELSEALL